MNRFLKGIVTGAIALSAAHFSPMNRSIVNNLNFKRSFHDEFQLIFHSSLLEWIWIFNRRRWQWHATYILQSKRPPVLLHHDQTTDTSWSFFISLFNYTHFTIKIPKTIEVIKIINWIFQYVRYSWLAE